MKKPDLKHGIYRVSHTLMVGRAWFTCESDLVFSNGSPYVVLEWAGPPDNLYPGVKLPLDPSLLVATSDGYFSYSGQNLEDPRKVQ